MCAGHGANIDVPREEDNRTPLHIAVNEGHIDVVAALLDAGAKVSAIECHQLCVFVPVPVPVYFATRCGR
jgi:hypothetical protein